MVPLSSFYTLCIDCREKGIEERWGKAEVQKTFTFPLYSETADEWFWDEGDLEEKLHECGGTVEYLHLYCTKRMTPSVIDTYDIFKDVNVDDMEIPDAITKAVDVLNSVIEKHWRIFDMDYTKKPDLEQLREFEYQAEDEDED